MSDDARVIREIAAVSDGDAPHTIWHYLYVPTSRAATEIAAELKQRGFRTEERLGADGENWLVLARHEAVPTEQMMVSMRRSMERLIAKVGGEYDGWEADVRPAPHDMIGQPFLRGADLSESAPSRDGRDAVGVAG